MTPERTERIRAALDRRQPGLVVLMEEIEDTHNIAAVMRSCDSVGVQDLFIISKDLSRYNYFGKQSSASAARWITVHLFDNVPDAVAAIRARGLRLLATHLGKEAVSLYDLDLSQPVALAFGNERKGISEELLRNCDANFIIPQMGMIMSLNLSVACAVSLYEAFRQREAQHMYEGDCRLEPSVRAALQESWSARKERKY